MASTARLERTLLPQEKLYWTYKWARTNSSPIPTHARSLSTEVIPLTSIAQTPASDKAQDLQSVAILDSTMVEIFPIQDLQVQLDGYALARDIQFAQQFSNSRPCPPGTRFPVHLDLNGFDHRLSSYETVNPVVNKPDTPPAPLPPALRRSHNIALSHRESLCLRITNESRPSFDRWPSCWLCSGRTPIVPGPIAVQRMPLRRSTRTWPRSPNGRR